MGLIKLFLLALAAGLGVVVEWLTALPPVVAAAFALTVWLMLVHTWRHRAE